LQRWEVPTLETSHLWSGNRFSFFYFSFFEKATNYFKEVSNFCKKNSPWVTCYRWVWVIGRFCHRTQIYRLENSNIPWFCGVVRKTVFINDRKFRTNSEVTHTCMSGSGPGACRCCIISN
jgi:hypothetical protein